MWFVIENFFEEILILENLKGFLFDSWFRFCLIGLFLCIIKIYVYLKY